MPTWFASQTNANINAANMWNAAPDGSGAWLTWPPASGDILVANGNLIRINVNTTVAELQNDTRGGATAGGQFQFNTNGVSMTANAYSSIAQGGISIVRVTLTSGTVFYVGNLYGGAETNARCMYMSNGIAATVNITGNLYPGSGAGAWAINAAGTHSGTINVTGTVYGNNTAYVAGVRMESTSTGTLNVTGNAIAQTGDAIVNAGGATVSVSGYAQASTTIQAMNNTGQGVLTVGETRSASNGRGAVLGAFRFASTTTANSMPVIAGSQRTLSVLNVAALVPAVEDVRAGLVYGDGAYTGTLALNRKRQTMAGRF